MESKALPKGLLAILSLLLLSFISRGQMTVDTSLTPQQLIQNVMVGQGVQVFNVTFTGAPVQVGYFDGQNDSIPFKEGVVMSTGACSTAVGPNDNGATSDIIGNTAGDPDLLDIAQQTNSTTDINDVAIIEFDFVPQGDSVGFGYVFGSDEYHEWVGSSYNDVFGFFISGPGITGPYQNNADNMALIPGTNDPISISDVNMTTNSIYYEDHGNSTSSHGDGALAPYDTDPGYHDADGHTVPLVAHHQVTCQDTFHLSLKIGDGDDQAYNAWVFLEGSSLSSNTIQVNLNTISNDSSIVRGCTDATVDLVRPYSDTTEKDTVHFDLGGNAVNGVDYDSIADSVIYDVGDTLASLDLVPKSGTGSGEDTLTISVPTVNECGDTIVKKATIYIRDSASYNVDVEAMDQVVDCPTDSVSLWVDSVGGGIPDYSFSWSDGTSGDTAYLPGNATDSLYVTATDSCNATGSDTAILDFQWDTLGLNSPPDTTYGCVTWNPLDLNASAVDGTAPYDWSWSPGAGNSATHTVTPDSTTEYEVILSDACGDSLIDTVLVQVPDTNGIEVGVHTPSPDSSIVEGCSEGYFSFLRPDTSQIDTVIFSIGGSAVMETHYDSISDSLFYAQGDSLDSVKIAPIVDAIPQQPDTVTVTTQFVNLCGDTIVNEASIYILDVYNVQVAASDTTIKCPTDSVPVYAQAQGGNLPYDYTWNDGTVGDTNYVSGMDDDTVWVTATDSCGNSSVADTSYLTLDYDSLELSTSADTTLACPGDPVDLNASASGGHTAYDYSWTPGGGTNPTYPVSPGDTTVYTVTITDSCAVDSLTDSVRVAVPQKDSVIALAHDLTVQCVGDTIRIQGEGVQGYGGYSYDWTGGPNDSVWSFPSYEDSVYVLTVTDQCGYSDQDSAIVTHPEYDPIAVDAEGPDTICVGDEAELSAEGSGGAGDYSYEWDGAAQVEELEEGQARTSPKKGGSFFVHLSDACGNSTQTELYVEVDDCEIVVPNVITPNGDGKNETFVIENLEHYTSNHLKVFNRWGNLVHEDPDYQNDWDGGDLTEGTYFYVLEPGEDADGPIKGQLTIIREE